MRISLTAGRADAMARTRAISGLLPIRTRHLCETPARAASGLTRPARWPARMVAVTGGAGMCRPPVGCERRRQARAGGTRLVARPLVGETARDAVTMSRIPNSAIPHAWAEDSEHAKEVRRARGEVDETGPSWFELA